LLSVEFMAVSDLNDNACTIYEKNVKIIIWYPGYQL